MAEFSKYTSGFNVSGTNIGIEAAKVQWPAINALTATSADSGTSGIMTPDHIQALVSNKVASVYKVKGTATRETLAAKEDNTNVVGDVYNVSDAGELPVKKGSETKITLLAGDNIVWTEDGWDKLASSVSLDGYATEEWVETNYSATSAAVANAAASKDDMKDTTKTGNLAQVGAITSYVEDTLAETVDIVDEITTTTNTASIPDVGAITAYSEKFVTSAFGTVIVTDKTGEGATTQTYAASAKNDKIKFVGGTDITLATTTDANGNPTITINNAYTAPAAIDIEGGNGVTAALVPANGDTPAKYQVSGVDATTAVAGVTKAAYYDEGTGLINLF